MLLDWHGLAERQHHRCPLLGAHQPGFLLRPACGGVYDLGDLLKLALHDHSVQVHNSLETSSQERQPLRQLQHVQDGREPSSRAHRVVERGEDAPLRHIRHVAHALQLELHGLPRGREGDGLPATR